MTEQVALITGTTGQDCAYFAEYLLSLGCVVHGVKRPSSSFSTARVDFAQGESAAGLREGTHR